MSSNIATNRLLIESEIEIAFKNALKTQKLELISKPYLSSTSSRGLLPSQVGSANTSDSESEDYYYMTVICDNLLLYYSPNGAGPTNSKRSNNILTEINLSYNALSVLSFQLLLQTLTDLQISSLKVLQFNHCQLIKDHCIILKYFLLSIRSLERLSVSSNQISNYGLQILSEAFLFDQDHLNSTSSATTALLSKTLISGTTQPQGGRAGLGGDGKPSTSSSSPMSITAANIQQHFPTLPPNSDNSVFTLEELDLSDNSFQDSGILSFCRACLYYNKKLLTMKSISSNLKRLFFNHNQITDKGIYCLAQLLNSKLTSNSGNITNSTKPQLLPPNRFGINLEEISFKQNPHITSHGIICLLGNNHLTTNPTNNTNNNALANTPTDQFHNHLTLYTNVMTCCIHQTLKHINFNECHLSLLIFQYLIPMISKGAFQTLETIHLEFSKNNSLEIIENSSKHYNKIYGNHLSTVKSVSSLSSNSINNYSSNPTSNSPHSSIVMSYCFQLLVDALLGINHKYRVSIKSIFLGQLPNIIFEQCITAKKKLQQYQQPSPNKEIIDYQNIYEDCRKSLEFMNPASEFFHISYISNIEHWLKAEQYHNALYTTTPLLSVFSQVTSPDGKKAASTNVSPLKGRNQQIPPKHPDTSQSKSLPKSSTSPFKGVSRGLDKSGSNAVDSQYQSPTKEKSSDKDQKPRMPTPSFSPDLLDRRRSGGRSSSPQRVASRAKQAPSRSASPTKRLGGTSQAEVKNKSKNDQGSSQRDEEVDDSDDWISTTRSQQLRASQDIPEIDESEISELPPHHLKKLQQEQTNAVHTLSTEIQKLLRVTTPAAIHVLSSKQQEEEDEAKKEDTTLVTSSVYSNALTVTTGNQKEGNKITILDPYEIEKANIASQLYLQQSMANANSAADIDQSFFQQQSLMSHDIQYELYNLTESLNQITEVKKEPKAVKDSTKGQKGKNSDLVVRSSSNSPTRVRRSNSSSPTRYSNNNNGYSKESINQYITKQITQYFEARYQKEIEAMQAAMINIANHYSKLDYRFQQFYEKKVMTKLMEFENRLIEMENRQVAFLTAAGMSLNPSQRLNERFIENLAHSTLQGPALNEFRQHFNQQQQQNQNLPSSNESFIGVSDSNPAVAPPSRNSNAALQQLQYRLDLLEQKLQVMTAPNPDPATETINSIKENSYYYPQDDRVQEESFVHRVTTATYSTAPENSLIQPTNLSEMDLDYKHQLLRQLSSLDAEIAREKSETFEVNHQNILLLQQHQHHYNSTSRAPTPSFYPVISSRSTSPLSTSNAPTPFPGFQDPSSTYNHYLNQDQQQNHQQNLQPTNFDQNYHYLDVSTDGFDTSFVPSALSNINRFERIAALHSSFNDQHFHSIDPPQSISSYPNVNHAQDERNSDNQRNNRRLSTNSNTSSNNEQKRSKTPVKSQPAPSSSTTQSVIPEYYYDTLLPDHYYNSNNVSENTIKRGSSTHTHQVADKQGKSNQVPPQSTLQPAVSHNHHPPQKGYMQATRSAYHKRNVPTQHH